MELISEKGKVHSRLGGPQEGVENLSPSWIRSPDSSSVVIPNELSRSTELINLNG
jgi:hypothetical protein